MCGHLVGEQGRPWKLNHGPDLVLHTRAVFGDDAFGHLHHQVSHLLKFCRKPNQRNHHLGHDGLAFGAKLTAGLKDGPYLHAIDLGIGHTQTNTAMPKHGVGLPQSVHASL